MEKKIFMFFMPFMVRIPGPAHAGSFRVRLETPMGMQEMKRCREMASQILEARTFLPSASFPFPAVRELICGKRRLADGKNASGHASPDLLNAP